MSPFDPNVNNINDLKSQPLNVIKTELPSLAKSLGISAAELLKSLTPHPGLSDGDCRCCGQDSW